MKRYITFDALDHANHCNELKRALLMGLEIWDEYLSQIAHCVSQDYARLNEFPLLCAKLGVELPKRKGAP